uniref:Uncharacterized protein n=1 Tax=Calidris pygmaea TaxID=425635 RepID=A0A8C3JMR0_9CHAR
MLFIFVKAYNLKELIVAILPLPGELPARPLVADLSLPAGISVILVCFFSIVTVSREMVKSGGCVWHFILEVPQGNGFAGPWVHGRKSRLGYHTKGRWDHMLNFPYIGIVLSNLYCFFLLSPF